MKNIINSRKAGWIAASGILAASAFGATDAGAASGLVHDQFNSVKRYWIQPDGNTVNTYKVGDAASETQAKAALESLLQFSFSNEKLGKGGVIVIQYTDGPAANDFYVGGNLTPSQY